MEQFISLPSTESYSRRTSITPSSSSVRMCGVLVELQWLGNLAFFLRPPSSTVSITSLASKVVSGMLSDEHQNVTIKQLLNRRNLANSDLVGGTRKKIFCSYSTRSQKYELFAFHNNNRETSDIWLVHMRTMECSWWHIKIWYVDADWLISHRIDCDSLPWMAFPAKKYLGKWRE